MFTVLPWASIALGSEATKGGCRRVGDGADQVAPVLRRVAEVPAGSVVVGGLDRFECRRAAGLDGYGEGEARPSGRVLEIQLRVEVDGRSGSADWVAVDVERKVHSALTLLDQRELGKGPRDLRDQAVGRRFAGTSRCRSRGVGLFR